MAAATGYSLIGPGGLGHVGSASQPFVVTLSPNGGTARATVVTPASTVAGTFTPATVALGVGAQQATFVFTPSTTGTASISTTSNNSTLSDPASVTYPVAAALTPQTGGGPGSDTTAVHRAGRAAGTPVESGGATVETVAASYLFGYGLSINGWTSPFTSVTAVIQASGTISANLPDGEHTYQVTMADDEGNENAPRFAPQSVTIDASHRHPVLVSWSDDNSSPGSLTPAYYTVYRDGLAIYATPDGATLTFLDDGSVAGGRAVPTVGTASNIVAFGVDIQVVAGSNTGRGGTIQAASFQSNLTGGGRISSGSGVPTRPGGVDPTAGDIYFQTDASGVAVQEIWKCTTGGASPVWLQGTAPSAAFGAMQTYTPALQGATDNPTVTYSVQSGRYVQYGKLVYVEINIVTTTMTKTTTADPVRVSLPVAAANVANNVSLMDARVENGTAVVNANQAYTTVNAAYLQFRSLNLGAASTVETYGITSLGVLTNTITFMASGFYESV